MAGRVAYHGGLVTDGLILHLDAARKPSYPGSGENAFDLANTAASASLKNGAGFEELGKGSFTFNKVDEYLEVSEQIQFGQNDPFTLSAWVNSVDVNNNQIINNENTSYVGYQLSIGVNSHLTFIFRNQQFPSVQRILITTSAGTVSAGEWHYVVATYDGSTNASGAKLYINGELKTTSIVSDTLAGDPISGLKTWIGYRRGSSRGPFNGNIAVVKIYNKELSASEVEQNYNALKGRFGL